MAALEPRRRQAAVFLVTVVATAAAVVVGGWLSDLRGVMHGALLAIGAFAFFPFVLVASGLFMVGTWLSFGAAALVLTGDPAALDPTPGVELIAHGGRLMPRYYGFLARRRHPAFWGVPVGGVVGGLALWGFLAAFVVPGESRTALALAARAAEIERTYQETGRLPPRDAVASIDGFGRPLRYEVKGAWKLASWRLTSLGYDGVASRDDLCIEGSTPAIGLVEAAAEVRRLVDRWRDRSPASGERLAGIRALRCDR